MRLWARTGSSRLLSNCSRDGYFKLNIASPDSKQSTKGMAPLRITGSVMVWKYDFNSCNSPGIDSF
ncbi:hypothetical protein THIOM_000282 [Candidatus Thiomargarita nelsonii]|uniref:Uncharacterized protein n=1 Tax=Candidatus Thiomargarita nelsonii TaxID=1003181 RepID=A0A176S758_9GAMM|nr:hypothetical protein THIOM_000282 [Candidatus Thiomargarita nelsonii]